MSEERLNEIKDSIDFQLRVCEINNYETDMIIEEKELYNEVLSNKILIQELRDTIDNQREKIKELENIKRKTIDFLNGIITESYLDEDTNIDIGLVEYAVNILQGSEE